MRSVCILLVAVLILLGVMPLSPASASHRFGDAAGWVKATGSAPRPIRVWSQAALGVDVGASIEPWNWLAGWRLFRRAGSRQAADVVFLPSPTPDTWTACSPTYVEPFHLCIVWVADPSIEMSRHELGHTLGFADHIEAERFAEGRYFSAKVCDASDHPEFSAYHGVMSYCDWTDDYRGWFGRRDQKMLVRAGYTSTAALASPGLSQAVLRKTTSSAEEISTLRSS